MFKNFILVGSIIGFVGCSSVTFKESDLGNDPKLPFSTFNPKPGVDVYDALKVDIVRQFKIVTSTDANGNQTTKRENVPYNPAGIDLGNGIFLDANRNLSISLMDFLDLRKREKFKVTVKGSGFLSSDQIMTKEGQKLTFESGGLLGSKTEYLLAPNSVTMKGGVLASDIIITYDNDSVTYDPKGFLGGLNKFTIQRKGNDFVSPGLIWDTVFRFDGKDDKISLGDNLVLQNKKTQMEVKSEGSIYTFYKTKNTLLIINQDGKGFKVTINGNLAKIIQNRSWGSAETDLIIE